MHGLTCAFVHEAFRGDVLDCSLVWLEQRQGMGGELGDLVRSLLAQLKRERAGAGGGWRPHGGGWIWAK